MFFIKQGVCYLFLLFSSSLFAESIPAALFLTWQKNPESTMTVCWITEGEQPNDFITYHLQPQGQSYSQSGYVRKLPGKNPYFIHTAELTQLQSNSSYRFSVNRNKEYQFHTLPATLHQSIKFVAGGDMYHDDLKTLRSTNKQAALTSPDFALVGGDIAYASGLKHRIKSFFNAFRSNSPDTVHQDFDRWLEWLQAWHADMVTPEGNLIPLVPVLGNHDTVGNFDQLPTNAPFFYALFPMPGQQGYNVLDFGNYMTLLLLDSGHTHPIDGQQKEWLHNTLEMRAWIPNKFALYHVPAYPSYRSFNYKFSEELRKCWTPIFDSFQLTMAFENHDHDYKRTQPLRAGRVHPQGVLYVGDGAWGVKKPRKPRNDKNHWYVAKSAQARHFLLIEIAQNERMFTAISGEGKILDTLKF